MTQIVTLELTDDLIGRAQKEAAQTDQPMERILVQWLERASNEAEKFFSHNAEYEIWSPYDSAEVAETLWKLLRSDLTKNTPLVTHQI
jgi:hypothetical protein